MRGVTYKQRGSENLNNFDQRMLDEAWHQGGISGVRQVFHAMATQNARAAAGGLDDIRLVFPILYLLLEDLIRFGLTDSLGPRNKAAIYICAQKIRQLQPFAPAAKPDDETLYGTLRWMLDTGIGWEGPGKQRDDYDSVLDYAAALIIGEYGDTAVLPGVAELIFKRNRQGLYIHDLAWSFFQGMNPDALELVAGYLKSTNAADVSLAKTLLGFSAQKFQNRMRSSREVTSEDQNVREVQNSANETERYVAWLRENEPYLYLTGEQMQMTSSPMPVDCDMEAKYLGKDISPKSRAPLTPLTEDEVECLYQYRTTRAEEQGLLAEYSHKLRRRDMRTWQAWLHKQITEQVFAARSDTGDEAV
jgi:hypothetical protein